MDEASWPWDGLTCKRAADHGAMGIVAVQGLWGLQGRWGFALLNFAGGLMELCFVAVVGAVVTEDHGYTVFSFGTCFTRGSCDGGGGGGGWQPHIDMIYILVVVKATDRCKC